MSDLLAAAMAKAIMILVERLVARLTGAAFAMALNGAA